MTDHAMLSLEHIGLSIGGARILHDVSLEVPAGEMLGVIGPNGAGKTTLFNVISGVVRPTAGRVMLDGTDVTRQPIHRRASAGTRPHVPDVEPVPRAQRARERAARRAGARRRRGIRLPHSQEIGCRDRACTRLPRRGRARRTAPTQAPRVSPTARSASSRSRC